jgi:hypothetical protein
MFGGYQCLFVLPKTTLLPFTAGFTGRLALQTRASIDQLGKNVSYTFYVCVSALLYLTLKKAIILSGYTLDLAKTLTPELRTLP